MSAAAVDVPAEPSPPSRLLGPARLGKLARFGTTQVVVQALAFAAGIVLVHALDPAGYGHYTLAISVVGVATVLIDLGLAQAVVAVGGPVHGDPAGLRRLLEDADAALRRLAWVGLPVAGVFGALLLSGHGLGSVGFATLLGLALLCGLVQVMCACALSVVRLRGEIALQQRLELAVNLAKLAAIAGLALVWIDARLALAANLAAAAATAWWLRRHLRRVLPPPAGRPHTHRAALFAFVAAQAPNSLYYCVSAQIAVWLVAWLGTAERVAEVGALGRLGMVFVVIGAIVAALVQPVFARASSWNDVRRGFFAVNAAFFALTAALLAVALLFPATLLWILGANYRGLTLELPWLVAASSLAAWASALYAMGAARGVLVPARWVIGGGLATMAVAVALFDVASVRGALQLNLVLAASGFALTFGFVGAAVLAGRDPAREAPR